MKKILITGSSKGIGKACTLKLLGEGYQIIGIARTHEKFNHYYPYHIDLAAMHLLESHFKKIAAEHPDIQAIVCSAGYGQFVELEQFSYAQMQAILNVNFLSQALLIKTFLPMLKKTAQAKIILLGSECALEGQKKGSMYCASKFALRGFAQSLQQECRSSNLAITLINSGMVRTTFFDELDFQPGNEEGNAILPEQIAETISMLLKLENNCVMQEINCQPMKKVLQKNVRVSKLNKITTED